MATRELKSIKFPDLGDTYEVKVTEQVLNTSLQALSNEVDTKIGNAKTELNDNIAEANLTKADAIVKSASGEVASFTDGGNGLLVKSLNVNIVPKQSGSGDPSPSNVRTISGYEGVNVTVVGDNVMPNGIARTVTFSGITYTSDGNGNYTIRGTSTGTDYVGIALADPFTIPSSSDYNCFFMNDEANTNVQVVFMYDSSVVDSWTMDRANKSATSYVGMVNKLCNGIRLRVASGTTVNMKLSPMFVPKSVSGESFIPYVGNIYPISLGQTVYGGTLDVVSGKLRINWACLTYNGSEAWWANADVDYFGLSSQPASIGSNDLTQLGNWVQGGGSHYDTFGYYRAQANRNIAVGNRENGGKHWASVEAFKTYLASNPLQVCYQLATPTEITLTPTQVKTLLGNNNIFADSGSVEVEYRADTTLAYNELLSLIASLS